MTLKVEATVDLAGKQVQSEPQVLLQGWHGDTPERETVVEDLGDDTVTIAGKRIACRIEQTEALTPGGRIVTKTWLSDRVSPYVLRRESTTYDRDNGRSRQPDPGRSRGAVPVAIRVFRRHRQAAELRVINTHPGGVTRTRIWSSLEVPGGSSPRNRKNSTTRGGSPGAANRNWSATRASLCPPCCAGRDTVF